MKQAALPLWFWPYAGVVLAAAWSPGLPTVHWTPPIWWPMEPRDAVLNGGAFLPIGLGLRGQRLRKAVLLTLGFALLMELPQVRLPRALSIHDPLYNLLGMLMGRALPLAVPRVLPRAASVALSLGALACGLALVPWALNRTPSRSPQGWAAHPLVLGAEPDGSRPLRGVVSAFSLHDRPLRPGGPRSAEWRGDGTILSWSAGGELRLDGPSGPRSHPWPEGRNGPVRLEGRPVFLPDRVAAHIRERVQASGRMAVRVRLRSEGLGPRQHARIVTCSLDPKKRCFSLGLKGEAVLFRIRTPRSGINARRGQLLTEQGAWPAAAEAVLTVSYDGIRFHAERDGHALAEQPSLASLSPVETLLLLQVAGCALAAAVLLRTLGGRRQLAIPGGLAGLGALAALGGLERLPEASAAALLTALALGILASRPIPPPGRA